MDRNPSLPLLPGLRRSLIMRDIYLLDAVSFLFRSYYAIRNMSNKKGEATGALYGFIRSIQKIIKDFSPKHLVAIFDGPNNKAARVQIYEHYKSNRTGMPHDFFSQLELAIHFCESSGIPHLSVPGFEADDLIGALAKWAEKGGARVFIFSSDKDLAQLVSEKVKIVHAHKDNLVVDRKGVETLYGVKPEQIVDYLAIMGDSSDNIPGIPGFGPKTAVSLLKEYGSLDNILSSLDQMKNRKRAEKIRLHQKEAELSRKLALLICDVPFSKKWEDYELKKASLTPLRALYQEMNFLTLLKELEKSGVLKEEEHRYKVIETLTEFDALIKRLLGAKNVVFDTETTTLQTMEASLVGVGFCIAKGEAFYVPLNGRLDQEVVLEKLRSFFESGAVGFVGHNIKYDMHVLLNHNIDLSKIAFDTMLASYLLNPQNRRHSLDSLCLERFGKVKTPIEELIGEKKKDQVSMIDVPIERVGAYCCEDADYTFRLKEVLEKEIEESLLAFVLYEIEQPLIPVMIGIERAGICLDVEKLRAMSKTLLRKIGELEKQIYDLAGQPFNVRSPKQLGEILFDKLGIVSRNKKRSTSADVLEGLEKKHPIVSKVLAFRALEKLRSTYVDALPLQINKRTRRIHCTFMQTVTATGRLSCQNPNLQNIPIRSEEGRKIRQAFCPSSEDRCYLSADYSQIELRLLAHMSQDPRLTEAFQKGEDIHTATAATVFDCPPSQVTKGMRSKAKAVNFGIIYGQQAFGLSKELGIDVKEAADFIAKYFEKYPLVKEFLERCKEKARQSGMAITLMNRRRMIPEIQSENSVVRAAAERLAVNTPLQGSQADIIKISMIRLHKELQSRPEIQMILQIHDELIFELPQKKVSSFSPLVRDIMQNVASLSIPLKVNITIGKNWGEC